MRNTLTAVLSPHATVDVLTFYRSASIPIDVKTCMF